MSSWVIVQEIIQTLAQPPPGAGCDDSFTPTTTTSILADGDDALLQCFIPALGNSQCWGRCRWVAVCAHFVQSFIGPFLYSVQMYIVHTVCYCCCWGFDRLFVVRRIDSLGFFYIVSLMITWWLQLFLILLFMLKTTRIFDYLVVLTVDNAGG